MKLPIKWYRRTAQKRRGEKGQAIVEFALVLPLMMMVFTGIFVFSIALYQAIALQTAADKGVQALALSENIPDIADPCAAATTAIQHATTLTPGLITISLWQGAAGSGTQLYVGNSNCLNIPKNTQLTVSLTYPCSYAIYKWSQSCKLYATESEPAQ